jgi:cytochrome c
VANREMGIDWVPFLKSIRRFRMKSSKIFAGVTVVLLNIALCTVAVGQDKATAEEVVAKVKEAASTLSKTGDVAQFNQKQSPWVWKDTYVFVEDCDKKVVAANPTHPELVGKELTSIKDAKSGKSIYPDPESFCKTVQEKSSGLWKEYWWPKPGEKEASRKLTYHLSAKGTHYVVSAGIYDGKATIKELSKLSSKE